MDIRIVYTSLDGVRKAPKFKTLKGARAFAAKWVGETPTLGSFYAASWDGIGKITVEGCTLFDLFPESADAKEAVMEAEMAAEMALRERYMDGTLDDEPEAAPTPKYTFDTIEEAEEMFEWACESWGERYAEAGSSFVFGGGNSYDANLVASESVGPKPRREDFGLPALPPPPPRPVRPIVDTDIPF